MIWSRMHQKRHGDLQPWREFEISPALNKALESILAVERLMITKGVSFPAGGSLLLIGRRPLAIVIRIPFNRPFATGNELDYVRTAIATPKFSGDGPFTAECHRLLEALAWRSKGAAHDVLHARFGNGCAAPEPRAWRRSNCSRLHFSFCAKCVCLARRQTCLCRCSPGHAQH